jgi:hypothetical protein
MSKAGKTNRVVQLITMYLGYPKVIGKNLCSMNVIVQVGPSVTLLIAQPVVEKGLTRAGLGFHQSRAGGDLPIFKWRRHLLKGLVQTAVIAHLQTFGE